MTDIIIEETMVAGKHRLRRLSLTEKWVREDRIEAVLHEAAVTFAEDFHVARLTGHYSSMEFDRVDSSPRHADAVLLKVMKAKRRIADAMGRMGVIAGSVVWDVIGCDMSLREHVNRSAGNVNVHEAKGRLIAGLDILATFYGYRMR